MGIMDKLAGVGVTIPATDPPAIAYSSYVRNEAHPFRMRRQLIAQGKVSPLVSCLMVTRGDRWTIKYALDGYRRQTYQNRQLIIVVDRKNYDSLSEIVIKNDMENVTIFAVDQDLTLGDCRNISIARAQGDILIQWDDDDLYDPLRIAVSVSALMASDAAAALLSRWLVWWPSRDLAAISGKRTWEGSIALWREHAPVYPGRSHGEDTYVTECLANTRSVTMIDAPLLYVYVVNGNNSFRADHYNNIISCADYVIRDREYDDMIQVLSGRVPISLYREEMLRHA